MSFVENNFDANVAAMWANDEIDKKNLRIVASKLDYYNFSLLDIFESKSLNILENTLGIEYVDLVGKFGS